uniref:Uncharacterized protein n=1 Tax=viral metagenome TaxID=1070528 RepID=A0A6M3LEG9_9ZZZZ
MNIIVPGYAKRGWEGLIDCPVCGAHLEVFENDVEAVSSSLDAGSGSIAWWHYRIYCAECDSSHEVGDVIPEVVKMRLRGFHER